MLDIVFIKDLELTMSIGVHEQEKQTKQRVIVNVEILKDSGGYNDSDLSTTICYETITNEIITIAANKHYNLVETFAEDIADIALKPSHAKSVIISVEKPDIIEQCQSVGVKITRSR